ncbi:50S ribosomal protein L13 [Candidatus Woesearchaeota archaeon]|nr:50S ribosomal protein L13 [Candidatus Woesearchaeota archaeon]
MIIDAKHTILGRLATHAAKQALLGEDVTIVNAELAVVTGDKKGIVQAYQRKYARGVPAKGPFIHRSSDRLVKRAIRGMLPYKTPRGREALKKIVCYAGVPEQYKDRETVTVEKAGIDKLPNNKYLTIKQLSKHLGGSP